MVQQIPFMTSATTPSGVASASESYVSGTVPPWKAMSGVGDPGWLTNGSALPQWIRYQFTAATIITAYRLTPWSVDNFPARTPTTWKLQGSSDGSSWTDLDTQTSFTTWTSHTPTRFTLGSPATYAYYRVNITANGGDTYTGLERFELEGSGVGQIVSPNYYPMTNDTTPSPFVTSASSQIDGFRRASNAFDGFLGTNQYWLGTGSGTDWVKIDIGSGNTEALGSYTVQTPTAAGLNVDMSPKNWTMEGSNNDSTWVTLDTRTNETSWSAGELRSYTCSSVPAAYRYFRINITANNGNATYTYIGELTFFGGTVSSSPDLTQAVSDSIAFSDALLTAIVTASSYSDSLALSDTVSFSTTGDAAIVAADDILSFADLAVANFGIVTPPSLRGNIDYDQIRVSARSGDGSKLLTLKGSFVAGHTVVFDADGNLIDAGH